eukprot:TRINITY_DN65333_c0_g1_i1.p1 TRINITY_DN65333_c0_g1~~TRINITY_DN65333_c0_g1_i1.p1  ORF type:complete len:353 (-),score=7.62 TRINITY_DN65333_c0_g1_i1:414-1472(-)
MAAMDALHVADSPVDANVTKSYITFKFRRTLTYWIGVLYMEGAFILVFAAGLGIATERLVGSCRDKSVAEEYFNAFVLTPYFIGGVLFTLACYVSFAEVLNLGECDNMKMSWWLTSSSQWRAIEDKRTFAIVGSNLLGALAYNLNGGASFFLDQLSSTETTLFVIVPGVIGGLAFVVGGWVACILNSAWDCKVSNVWFLSWSGLIGGILFLVASSFGAAGMPAESEWWCFHLPFLVGSALFGIGGQVSLWMWKCEQYGLMFAPGINKDRYANPEELVSLQEDYGFGRPSTWQVLWVTIYALNASASLIDIGIILAAPRFRNLDGSLCSMQLSDTKVRIRRCVCRRAALSITL